MLISFEKSQKKLNKTNETLFFGPKRPFLCIQSSLYFLIKILFYILSNIKINICVYDYYALGIMYKSP